MMEYIKEKITIMRDVILLSSFHMELGKCNPRELYSIIEKIHPEVIFEELPLNIFRRIYFEGYLPKSIEAIAVKEFLESYNIKHYPVDTLNKDFADLFDGYEVIEENSIEYRKLLYRQISLIKKYGYAYINSSASSELSEKIQNTEWQTLLKVNDIELISQYRAMNQLHYKRDKIMLENIYDHHKSDDYSRALFICGAEHRKSIIQLIAENKSNGKDNINWIYYTDGDFVLDE